MNTATKNTDHVTAAATMRRLTPAIEAARTKAASVAKHKVDSADAQAIIEHAKVAAENLVTDAMIAGAALVAKAEIDANAMFARAQFEEEIGESADEYHFEGASWDRDLVLAFERSKMGTTGLPVDGDPAAYMWSDANGWDYAG